MNPLQDWLDEVAVLIWQHMLRNNPALAEEYGKLPPFKLSAPS